MGGGGAQILTMGGKRAGHRVTSFYPWTVLPVADGYMEFITMQDRQWDSFMEAIGSPAWATDPRFQGRDGRTENAEEIEALLVPHVRDLTRAELWKISREGRISFQPVHRIDELVEADHMQERAYFQEILDGENRPMVVPGAPYKLSGTPWTIRRKAPRLGEHTAEVLEELAGLSGGELVDLRRAAVV